MFGRNQGRLICIIGIDGAGKTTTVKILKDVLENRNLSVKHVYGGYDSVFTRPIIAPFRRMIFSRIPNAESGIAAERKRPRRNALSNRIFKSIFGKIVLLEYSFLLFFRIRLPLIFGKLLISDRFVFDSAINVADYLVLGNDGLYEMTRQWLNFFPKPNYVFWIDTPLDICMKRKEHNLSEMILSRRINNYRNMAQKFGFVRIDGTLSLNELLTYFKQFPLL